MMNTPPATFNSFQQRIANVFCRSHPPPLFICNIILDPRPWVNKQFSRIHRPAETAVKLSCVNVVRIVLRIIDVFFRSVDTEAINGDLPVNTVSFVSWGC